MSKLPVLNALLFSMLATNLGTSDSEKVTLVSVKMKDLVKKHIAASKGRVVVIHIWASYHPPSKRYAEDLVRLHEKFTAKGVTCMSLSIDPEDDDRDRILEFLVAKKARFPNFWLKDDFSILNKEWAVESIPTAVVIRPDGEIAHVFRTGTGKWNYAEVEKFVRTLIRE